MKRGTNLHASLDVSVTLREVDRSELSGSLAVLVVGAEDSSGSLTLDADTSSHLTLKNRNKTLQIARNLT